MHTNNCVNTNPIPMKRFLFSLLISVAGLFVSLPSVAQFEQMKNKFDDVLLEIEEDIFTLRFADAVTGNPVPNAAILVENLGEFTTDE